MGLDDVEYDPDVEAVDGFTWAEIEEMALDSVVQARCTECKAEYSVEPDARKYDCYDGCGAKGTVTSLLIKLGLM